MQRLPKCWLSLSPQSDLRFHNLSDRAEGMSSCAPRTQICRVQLDARGKRKGYENVYGFRSSLIAGHTLMFQSNSRRRTR